MKRYKIVGQRMWFTANGYRSNEGLPTFYVEADSPEGAGRIAHQIAGRDFDVSFGVVEDRIDAVEKDVASVVRKAEGGHTKDVNDSLEFARRRNVADDVRYSKDTRHFSVYLTKNGVGIIAEKHEIMKRGKVVSTSYTLPPFEKEKV